MNFTIRLIVGGFTNNNGRCRPRNQGRIPSSTSSNYVLEFMAVDQKLTILSEAARQGRGMNGLTVQTAMVEPAQIIRMLDEVHRAV